MLREALTLERLHAMQPDEAAALLVARRAEGLTGQEESLLDQWLAADAAHVGALERAQGTWDIFDEAEGDEILAAMRAHAIDAAPPRRIGWPRAAVAAAAAVLLVLVSTLLLMPGRGSGPGGPEIATIDYVSKPGEVRTIKLADDSTMTLDADSKASARFGRRERLVELERGRAFFDVTHDASRPFTVAAATRRVVALGTSFEVALGEDRLTVTLIEGRVAVEPRKPGGRTVMLAPGQQFIEAGGAANVRTLEPEGAEPAAWRSGLLDLDDRPLSEAVAMVNRTSRERIIIRDPAVGAMRISGQFRAGDAERFARTVAEVHPVRVVRRADGIELVLAK